MESLSYSPQSSQENTLKIYSKNEANFLLNILEKDEQIINFTSNERLKEIYKLKLEKYIKTKYAYKLIENLRGEEKNRIKKKIEEQINEIINKKLKDENKNLKIKNEELSNKLSLLKSNIKELKVQLDNTIYAQLDSKQKKVEDLSMQLGINKSKINSLNKALKFYEDNYMKQKTLRNKYFSIL